MANTNLLKIFIEVAKCGNITKASEILFISQPAITKSIKQLENELGGKLFERKNKGVELTNEGKAIYEKVNPLLSQLDNIYNYFPSVEKLKAGVLRIGTVTSNVTILLRKSLNKFINSYPNIEIKITRAKENALVSMLRNNELDLLLIDSKSVKSDMEEVIKFDVEYSVIGNEYYYYKFKNKPMSKEDFSLSPLALINQGNTSRVNIDSYFNKFGITLNAKYEMENYGLIMDLIKSGVAIGVVNLDYFENEVKEKEIYKINTNFEIDQRNISLVRLSNQLKNPACNQFVKLFDK